MKALEVRLSSQKKLQCILREEKEIQSANSQRSGEIVNCGLCVVGGECPSRHCNVFLLRSVL